MITRDDEIVDNYISDSRISFTFTLNGFYNLFKSILLMNKDENLKNIPKNLPMILISGERDPVGNFGKDVSKAFKMYNNLDMKNVSMKLYSGDRHEILNELDKEQVYDDIVIWIGDLLTEV